MEYTLDLGRMVSALKKADTVPEIPDFIESEGEKYIYDNVIMKYISKQPIYVGDIDFDAFDEDDITTLIDNKSDFIEGQFCTLHNIVNTFAEMPAMVTTVRKYF
mgnify:CR=1 FL=1|jgi:hypothetical protein